MEGEREKERENEAEQESGREKLAELRALTNHFVTASSDKHQERAHTGRKGERQGVK